MRGRRTEPQQRHECSDADQPASAHDGPLSFVPVPSCTATRASRRPYARRPHDANERSANLRRAPRKTAVGGRRDAAGAVSVRNQNAGDPPVEDVPFAVELRDGEPLSVVSQVGDAATSGAAVAIGV